MCRIYSIRLFYAFARRLLTRQAHRVHHIRVSWPMGPIVRQMCSTTPCKSGAHHQGRTRCSYPILSYGMVCCETTTFFDFTGAASERGTFQLVMSRDVCHPSCA